MPKITEGVISSLARSYNKPVDFVRRCIARYDVKDLPEYRTPNDGLGDFFSDLTSVYDLTPSMTKQEFTAECDINTIMARFKASGGDPSVLPLNTKSPKYGDFTSFPDSYHAALNYVNDTKAAFLAFDASVRSRFDNDPQKFLDFIADPANQSEAVSLGLINSPAVSSPAEGTVDKSLAATGV